MKKILLSMAIASMTFTVTLYAACTADVNMSGNKITSLGVATADGDAVNYEQLKIKEYPITINLDHNLSVMWDTKFSAYMSGAGQICLSGFFRNTTGVELNYGSVVLLGTLPVDVRPTRAQRISMVTTYGGRHAMIVANPNGRLEAYIKDNLMPNNEGLALQGKCFIKE